MKLFAVTTEWWEGDGRVVSDSGSHTSVVYADTPNEAKAKALKVTGDVDASAITEIDPSLPLSELLRKLCIKVVE